MEIIKEEELILYNGGNVITFMSNIIVSIFKLAKLTKYIKGRI